MHFKHTDRKGFLLGFIDFFTAGLFFLVYMQLGLQDELDEILGHKTQRYYIAYLLGIPTLFIYTLVWMAKISEELREKAMAWEIRHGGLSGRTAQQFINDLAGSLFTP